MRHLSPEGRSASLSWATVWWMGIFFVGLAGALVWIGQWTLAAATTGLTMGFGLLVASRHREEQGEDGSTLRYAGLALLLALSAATLWRLWVLVE